MKKFVDTYAWRKAIESFDPSKLSSSEGLDGALSELATQLGFTFTPSARFGFISNFRFGSSASIEPLIDVKTNKEYEIE